ncbi:hypothetical protein NLO72_21930 [Pseudomonas tremae]|uniref:hypothetical protein n=1 Tax=Pseudomonas syringae group TaxID=136849 RepID=UPI0003F57708|nr:MULTISPECIES: hypothetical protein [Pseudomonas syringae group]KPZ23587.1 Unknown protein sequence [Pseudomonas coronafaciens pv. zizaniae]MCQ2991868.1 hypothetical protein [Pseudomonas tremae]RMR34856.1 hypothetical protein ALP87_03798 [Pseudomonas syringae pv. coriandricola]RMS92906.1 hypothetical protein ALP56_03958 [Pseudomonas coronafaciens pv. oryzae]RMS96165.1 hypothetical protein ALP57_03160 [Pseudomonas coronafaciens pv. oryzae]
MEVHTYRLKGLAEGIVGKAEVVATSYEDIFKQYPQLNMVKEKLILKNKTVIGLSPCDG